MIHLDDNRLSEQMLPVLLETVYHSQKLSTSDAVPSLRRCESAASIADDKQLPTLLLLKNSTKDGVRCVSVKHILSFITWCNKNRCCQETIL